MLRQREAAKEQQHAGNIGYIILLLLYRAERERAWIVVLFVMLQRRLRRLRFVHKCPHIQWGGGKAQPQNAAWTRPTVMLVTRRNVARLPFASKP